MIATDEIKARLEVIGTYLEDGARETAIEKLRTLVDQVAPSPLTLEEYLGFWREARTLGRDADEAAWAVHASVERHFEWPGARDVRAL